MSMTVAVVEVEHNVDVLAPVIPLEVSRPALEPIIFEVT